jgi:hypothetical protein
LLVSDLVADHESGRSYAGPPVAAWPSSGLVYTGTDGGDSSQVFSMFDVLSVTGSDFAAPWNGPQAPGLSRLAVAAHDRTIPDPPLVGLAVALLVAGSWSRRGRTRRTSNSGRSARV